MTGSYLLLDAARCGMDAIEKANEICSGEHSSLYLLDGNREYLKEVAPYIYTSGALLQEWFVAGGWGDSWGMLVFSKAGFSDCWKHFRQFLLVKKENGEEMYFRFYDPRVLRRFLPNCHEDQIINFFGPVEKFLVEGSVKEEAIEFSHKNGFLQQRQVRAENIFGKQPGFAAKEPAAPSKIKRNSIMDDDLLNSGS
jgi:hypothetical protein